MFSLISLSEGALASFGRSFLLHPNCKLELQDLIWVMILVLLPRVLIYEPPSVIGAFCSVYEAAILIGIF